MLPRVARVLPNQNGTAPGLYLRSNRHVFLLPGPPRELQPMFRESVLPILREIRQGPAWVFAKALQNREHR